MGKEIGMLKVWHLVVAAGTGLGVGAAYWAYNKYFAKKNGKVIIEQEKAAA